ncbi:MAG: hypothetical protein QOJ64_2143 [Acidobacteriota bacterium]|nr:hypothetical protein [Acidobacteriota bacterium]
MVCCDASTAAAEPTSEVLPGEKFPRTRERYLTESEVSEWTEAKIRYAINEMFARHGAAFDKADLKNTFTKFSWYKPRKELTLDQIEQDFSEMEKENLKLLAYFRDAKSQGSKRISVTKEAPARQKTQRTAAESPANSFLRRFVQGLTTGLQDRSPSPGNQRVPTQAASETVRQPSGSLITPGSERLVIKGLYLGDGPASVKSFLQTNNLIASESPNTLTIKGKKSVQEVTYVSNQVYSNGKSGVGEISVDLQFTPPVPTPQGVVSLVYSINYKTHYGEGLTQADIVAELEKKYGKGVYDGIASAMWAIPKTNNDCALQAYIRPPREVGAPGELELWSFDHPLLWRAQNAAAEYLDTKDAQRPKDQTKPDF